MASRGTRTSIRWDNVQSGYSLPNLTSGRVQLFGETGGTWSPTATVGTVGAFTRIRHVQGLITMSTTGDDKWVGHLMMWKGSNLLDPLNGSEVPADSQEIFFRQPISILGDMVQRYTFRWPKVSIDQDQRWSVFLLSHEDDGETDWGYSYQYKRQTRLQ